MEDSTPKYYELIAKKLKGELQDNEVEILENWLSESDQNRGLVQELSAVWEKYDQEIVDVPQAEEVWQGIETELSIEKTESSSPIRRLYPWIGAAASLLIGLMVWLMMSKQTSVINEIRYITQDETRLVDLPDGSQVTLNEYSELTFLESKTSREIHLSGEAVFDVESRPDIPFIVITDKLETQVLGTIFVVRAYEASDEASVIVLEGKVSVIDENDDKNVLIANHRAIVKSGRKTHVEEWSKKDNQISWFTKSFVFDNESLSQVGAQLEKVYGMKWVFENAQLESCRFTGVFEDATLEEIVETIRYALSLEVVVIEGEVHLKGIGCQEKL